MKRYTGPLALFWLASTCQAVNRAGKQALSDFETENAEVKMCFGDKKLKLCDNKVKNLR